MKVFLTTLLDLESNIIEDFLFEIGFQDSIISSNNNCIFSDYAKQEKYFFEVSSLDKNLKKILLTADLEKCLISHTLKDSKNPIDIQNKFQNNKWNDSIKNEFKDLLIICKKIISFINNENFLKVKFENLIGENDRELQIYEFRKITNYLEIEITPLDLESKISNVLNKKNYIDMNLIIQELLLSKRIFLKKLKKIGFNKINFSEENTNKKYSLSSFLNKKVSYTKKSFYDKYWKTNKQSKESWSYGINIVDNLIDNYEFKTVLDAGCGSGDVVRYLLSKGFLANGIELSGVVLNDYAKDLLRKGIVKQGSLKKLPYKNNTFDVIFSSEVLEHIHQEDISDVINEFYRVTKKYIFLTISLRPSSNFNKYHITLKERNWWEGKFLEAGFIKDDELIKKLQALKIGATNKEVLEIGPTKSHIHEMDWFIENPPLDFRGELEPWYFIFKKGEK